ncbi:MAG TPA: choice-of-anchor tandem repeat GloVer-containing protein [Candidatus Tumulicola sp.]
MTIVICGSLLIACAGPGPNMSPGTVTAVSQSDARPDQATFKLVYAFPNHTAGAYPYGSLFALKGLLYGTTLDGGSQCGSLGCGTVFSLSLKPSVKETVLHSFANSPDGWTPYSGVTALGNAIYGTTARPGYGIVYSVELSSGSETVLHYFKRTRDGRTPIGGMAVVGRMLYGTTSGGYDGHGSVFSIDSSGHESVLYRFKGRPDGAISKGDLLAIGNVLYGTTESGGSNPGGNCSRNTGCGTVFSIALGPSGPQETVLYRFRGGANDGAVPMGGLISVNGLLYGVTASGGEGGCEDFDVNGCGTVFSLNPSTGQEVLLHKFQSGGDGIFPVGNLAHRNGTLYGVTYSGGTYTGTVFSLKLDGSGYTILHNFLGGRKDGSTPEAGLVLSNGIVYGTTGYGGGGKGCHSGGCGTIFSITPP